MLRRFSQRHLGVVLPELLRTTTLTNSAGVIHLPAKLFQRGTYTFTLIYSGDDKVKGSSANVTFHVTNPAGN